VNGHPPSGGSRTPGPPPLARVTGAAVGVADYSLHELCNILGEQSEAKIANGLFYNDVFHFLRVHPKPNGMDLHKGRIVQKTHTNIVIDMATSCLGFTLLARRMQRTVSHNHRRC